MGLWGGPGGREGGLTVAALTELSLRNSALSRWDPALVEPQRAVGWARDYGELPVPSAWERVCSELLRTCRELVEIVKDAELKVEVEEAGWEARAGVRDALFHIWLTSVGLPGGLVRTESGRGPESAWEGREEPSIQVAGGIGWDGRDVRVLEGDEIAESWEGLVDLVLRSGKRVASAWPVPGEDALVVSLVERKRESEEVGWEDVVSEVRGAVRRLLNEARDLNGRGWESVWMVPYAAALPPCTGVDAVRRDERSLAMRHPEVLSEVLAVGWRELIEAVLELLDADLSDPRARFYAVYRLLWGYPEPEDAPDRAKIEPLLRALRPDSDDLSPDDLPLDAHGRLKTYRERRGARLKPRENPIDALHAALLALREGDLKSFFEDLPESVQKETVELALAVTRAADCRGEDHPETELARGLLGASVDATAR